MSNASTAHPAPGDWPIFRVYEGDATRTIVLPVGGIGTGFFGLGGRGQLTDWQLMSRPNRGWRPKYAHLLARFKAAGEPACLRVLEGDILERLEADMGAPQQLAGIPRFRDVAFDAAYPFGRVRLSDDETPFSAAIEAFNPLAAGDTETSSLPIGLLTVTLKNRTAAPAEATVAFLLSNFIGSDGIVNDLTGNVTSLAAAEGWSGLQFAKPGGSADNPRNGDIVLLCDQAEARAARTWPFRGRPWGGETLGIIESLLEDGVIADAGDAESLPSDASGCDSSLCAQFHLEPGEARAIRFIVAWRFPARSLAETGWRPEATGPEAAVQNHYAGLAPTALEFAAAAIRSLPALRSATAAFVTSIANRDAPARLREAALFNLTALRSHTCFRLSDGTFAAFEGCNASTGCCHGSCTHVWNYEEATLRLFPDLHRSMLESHLRHATTPAGENRFRLTLPVIAGQNWSTTAADGQMGLVVRAWQQYQSEGDKGPAWLREVWPAIRSLLEYCWQPGGWDADQDGVMEGSQHNTYDVEFFGPNPLCTVWYLAALRAGSALAVQAGDPDFAARCTGLADHGRIFVDSELFNGEYYIQLVRPRPAAISPMTSMTDEQNSADPRFQVGTGCLIDQLVGQFKANRAGLGDLLDRSHIVSALKSIVKYNFQPNMRGHYNNMRTFAAADEPCTLICSWPHGGRPEAPLSYWGECMTGFEYQLAALLLDYGLVEEGERAAEAVRKRHEGHNRNPFNEPECGSYYARCMASWALLDAWDDRSTRAAAAEGGPA